ncbi:CapA family protein [Rhodocyclaceae bacterium SMB388]
MNSTISFCFVGDLALGRSVKASMAALEPSYPFESVSRLLSSADLTIANFEGFVVNDEWMIANTRGTRMGVDSRAVERAKEAGVDVVCLANNHVMDVGERGLQNTISVLNDVGIDHFGAGAQLSHAGSTRLISVNGARVALIGACDFSPHHASRNAAGVFPVERRGLLSAVSAARTRSDIVVVSLHADIEFVEYPAPWRVRLSRELIDCGASMVIQHHPHVIQGIEEYNGGLIAYSLGNFVFSVKDNHYQNRHRGTDLGMLLCVEIAPAEAKPIRWNAVPLQIDEHGAPRPLTGAAAAPHLARLAELSEGLADPRLLRTVWRARARDEVLSGLADAYWSLRRLQFRGAWAEVRRVIGQPEMRLLVRGALGLGA